MTAVIHFLIGVATRCLEEKHDEQIKDWEGRLRIQAFIIVKYIEKYGQLRVKDQLCRHLVHDHHFTPVIGSKMKI